MHLRRSLCDLEMPKRNGTYTHSCCTYFTNNDSQKMLMWEIKGIKKAPNNPEVEVNLFASNIK